MLKVLGFVKRNSKLSHDEYRAGHVGYHNSFGRRLNHIRGYLLNVASNTPVANSLGKELVHRLTCNEPEDFDKQWDGWGQLMFDSFEDYLAARSPARDFPGELGLQMDPMVGKLGDDLDELYAGTPFQFQVDEFISRPVVRPERKLFKLVQFGQRPVELPIELFRAYWTGRYASLASTIPGLRGLIINFRTPLDVIGKFFAADAEGFTLAGIERRQDFYSLWDGMAEYWFDSEENFVRARSSKPFEPLYALEQRLFSRLFYREIDETVAVLPKRDPAPNFYHR